MSDHAVAIGISDVSRMFKRYRHPRYRVMEAFGLPLPKNAYDEFWALRGISLELHRGESLGIIGQNGAGKSTLLNIICGRMQPTSGTVTVRGNIQALMDLGTGFHPEFSGRDNILSALAVQGVTGRDAMERLTEIVDFSELADFIDQPVKTYSTGMYARLAFSTATSIMPDVLIIDEVLGAGDAYFAAKCADRMLRLTQDLGATVLFVSHDMSAVQRLCKQAIWIERGRITMAGLTLDLAKAYHNWVLERDEARLRAETSRAVLRLRRRGGMASDNQDPEILHFRLVTTDGQPPHGSHAVTRIMLLSSDGHRFELSPGDAMDNVSGQTAYLLTDPQYMCWSEPRTVRGRGARCYENTGGSYQHAPIYFRAPGYVFGPEASIEIEYLTVPEEALAVEIHEPRGYRRLGLLAAESGPQHWQVARFSLAEPNTGATVTLSAASADPAPDDGGALPGAEPRSDDRWETKEARFLEVWPCAAGTLARKHVFARGEDIAFRIVAEIRVDLPPFWVVAVVFDQQGTRIALLADQISENIMAGVHEFVMVVHQPTLRQGEYVLTFELLPEFDYNWSEAGRFPYLCLWALHVHFKIDEDHRGTVDLGRVYLPVSVTHRTVEGRTATADPEACRQVATEGEDGRPVPMPVGAAAAVQSLS